jgi:hypothetical protein
MCLLRLSVPHRDRHDLVGIDAGVPGRLGARLAPGGVLVDRVARDAVALRQVLRRLGHREITGGIAERFPERILERRGRPEPEPPARAAHDVRRLAHRFGAAHQHHPGLAKADLLRPLGHRLESRRTEAVDGHRRHLDRQADPQPDMTSEIGRVRRGLEDVAEHHVVDLLGGEARARQRFLRGDRGEVGGGALFQRPAERAEPGPNS